MKLVVGNNVDSWCTKCKLVLAHTIEAIVGSEIKRVHCNTCRGKHSFRANEPGTYVPSSRKSSKSSEEASSKRATKALGGAAKASDYERMVKGREAQSLHAYSVKGSYQVGEMLSHQVFGVGVVTADKGVNKMEVLFPTGPKVLVHGK